MTAAEVLDTLPDVEVQVYNRIFKGYTAGRRNAFATVRWNDQNGMCHEAQYAWETIARSLTDGKPLRVLGNG